MTRTAQCCCGRVQVTVESEPLAVVACHCDFCQKRTGSVFQVCGYFADDERVAVRGETKTYNGLEIDGVGTISGGEISYHFCPTCGSTLYWHYPGRVHLGIAVGNFVDPDFPAPTIELHTALRHRWVPAVPEAQQFVTVPT